MLSRYNDVMGKRIRVLFGIPLIVLSLGSFVIFAVATCGKAVLNNAHLTSPDQPSWTASEARARGVWVCDVSLSPTELTWKGDAIAFGDVWVEEVAQLDHKAVWIPYYRRVGGYYLCFTLARGIELLRGDLMFVLAEERSSFGSQWSGGQTIFYQKVDDYETLASRRISLTESFKELPRNISIRLKR
jgi:hypothetical protein